MKIALDVMGGDFAPLNNLEGACLAAHEIPEEHQIVLIGKEDIILDYLDQCDVDSSHFTIVPAEDVIDMGENPTRALAQKPNASINIGFSLLKEKKIDAFCSAGNTGAIYAGAMFSIKTVDGVLRPGMANFVPKETGKYGVILDIGANPDCKPEVLYQLGQLGSAYARHVFEIVDPTIGLLNLGEEETKGTAYFQAAYQLFKKSQELNFVGNIEGRDLFNSKADVIVCDGFTGNVIVKMAESMYDMLKERDLMDDYFSRFNYEEVGGSPILGVNGNVIICHGVSSSLAIKNSLLLALKMAESGIHLKIKEAFSNQLAKNDQD